MPTTIREPRRGDWVIRQTITADEARQILERAANRGLTGQAKRNKSLTRQQAYDIFINAINTYDDDAPISSIIAGNIHREFGKL